MLRPAIQAQQRKRGHADEEQGVCDCRRMLDKDVVPLGLLLRRQKFQILGDIFLFTEVEKRIASHFAAGVAYAQKDDAEVQHVEQRDVCGKNDAATEE